MDTVTPKKRSEIMRHVRRQDTLPEIRVRSIIHRLGFRFRLHPRHLPGKPDLIFPVRKKAIFVHGCFWHLHENCPKGAFPKSNTEYWIPKLLRNRERDARKIAELESLGWEVMVIWQCELTNPDILLKRIKRFLGKTK